MKTILVIDDDTTNLVMARNALGETYNVVPLSSGVQGLKYLQKNNCDLVLLDIDMPELDGIETLRKIREMDKGARLPVVFLTANRQKETVIESSKLGIIDYIAKPFEHAALRERVNNLFVQIKENFVQEDLRPRISDTISMLRNGDTEGAITQLVDVLYRLS